MVIKTQLLLSIFSTALISLGLQGTTLAASFTETTDAGELPGTAQALTTQPAGTPLDSLSGSLSSGLDIDMFQIFINGTTPFSATTASPGVTFDSMLFLFDSTGKGVFANDDKTGDPLLRAELPATSLSAGIYYLAISSTYKDAVSVAGLIFPDSTLIGTSVSGPTGPGGGSPITSWQKDITPDPDPQNYAIALTGAQFGNAAPVPYEPHSALGVLMLGGWGTISHLKKRKKLRKSVDFETSKSKNA